MSAFSVEANSVAGAIEKGANDGQLTYANDLIKALRLGLSSRPRTMTSTSKGKKVRKRKSEGDALKSGSVDGTSASKASTWGLLEPLRRLFTPVLEICKPLFSLQSLVGLLVFLLIISWFGNSRHRHASPQLGFLALRPDNAKRMAAYEEIWRTEESALWDWLEERIGMDDGHFFPTEKVRAGPDGGKTAEASSGRFLGGMNGKSGSISDREVEWAIELTEEKLRLLKQKLQKEKRSREATNDDPPNKNSEPAKDTKR